MVARDMIAKGRRLFVLCTACMALTVVVLGGLAWYRIVAYKHAAATIQQQLRLTELKGSIIHLDEVLTMSARMAAATGNLSWETRYHQFEPQLDAAIKEALRLAPEAGQQATAETDTANLRLVEMETRSFELVRTGQAAEAQQVLFSPEYEEQKHIYAQGMRQLTALLDQRVRAGLQDERQKTFGAIWLMGLAIAVLLVAWTAVLLLLRQWQRVLLTQHEQLANGAEQLRDLNRNLDEKVRERTSELAQANQHLATEAFERKKSEATARTNEERFRTLASHAPVGIFMTDSTGDCTFVNDTWCHLTGITLTQAEGRGWIHALHPDDADRIVQEWYRCAKSGEAFSAEYRYRTPQGQVVWVQGAAIALRDAQRGLTGYLGTAMDITVRKQASADMERKGQELQTLNAAMMGREERVLELKAEVNVLLESLQREKKYSV